MRLKPIIFKLYGEKYEVKKKINHGKNSKCFVVKKGNNLFFLNLCIPMTLTTVMNGFQNWF